MSFSAKKLSTLVLLTVIYIIAGKWGLSLAFVNASATPVWPPTGISLAALLLLGPWVWPGIFVGAFLTNITTAGSFLSSLCIASGNTLEALCGAFLVKRFANGKYFFKDPVDILKFSFFGGLLSTTVSATGGFVSLALLGFASWSDYASVWTTWWLGDATGCLIITPFLVSWADRKKNEWDREKTLEAILVMLVIVLVNWTVFGNLFSIGLKNYPLAFLSIPPLLWVAFRYTQRETTSASLLMSGIALWGTLHGFGSFWRGSPNTSMLLLQAFMGVTSLMALSFSALIAALKREQENVFEMQKKLASIVESAEDAIVSLDLNGTILTWNQGAEKLYGYTAEEIVGLHVSILIPPEFSNELPQIMGKIYRSEPVAHYETTRLHKDGHLLDVSVSISSVKDIEGKVIGASAVVRDIAEKKRIEKLKDEFLGSVSHELRTPLAIIAGSVGNLKDGIIGALSKKQDQVVHTMDRNVARLMRIIDNLLDLSRLESGKLKINLQNLNLTDLIHSIFRDFQVLFQEKKIILEVDLPAQLPHVQADPESLRQVIGNLLNNAIRFAKEKVVIGARVVDEMEPDFVQVYVIDDGVGIPESRLGDVFNKFVQVNRPRGGEGYKGTGLGLAICKEIIQQHHGKIWVESAQGQGAGFYFILPVYGNKPKILNRKSQQGGVHESSQKSTYH